MSGVRTWAPRVAAVLVVIGGAGTESQAQYNRRTPIVEAVAKTKASIVTIRVDKRTNSSLKEVVGTGVIVDERGFVITNQHVVAGSERLVVILDNGTELVPQVVKEDRGHDLAILRVQSKKRLQALPLGPASDLMVGETVIAVGHPFGYTNTVSTGIISALGREVSMPGGILLTNLIQTNATINPGNSGGPLLNINGELVGINVALRDGAQGIAFALNADLVQQVLCTHLSASRVAGVQHGLGCQEAVVPESDPHQRVVVRAVAERSPAASAGLRSGDEIVFVAARKVSNRFDVERALYDCRPGERVAVTVIRDGKQMNVSIALATAGR